MKNKKCRYLTLAAALLLPLMLFLQHAFAKEEKKIAYLTFDDGPTLNTPEIVDTLSRYNAKATFFVLEERIKLYPDFIKQIVHNGNSIGLHGISHSEAIYENETSPLEEMKKTEKSGAKVVKRETGTFFLCGFADIDRQISSCLSVPKRLLLQLLPHSMNRRCVTWVCAPRGRLLLLSLWAGLRLRCP